MQHGHQQGHHFDVQGLMQPLREWAHELGFSQIGVADVDLPGADAGLRAWLDAGFHGSMHYMAAHGTRRTRPAELVPGTVRVITARMDYLPRAAAPGGRATESSREDLQPDALQAHRFQADALQADPLQADACQPEQWQAVEWQALRTPQRAVVSTYARGRDYHKVLRSRLQRLADRLAERIGPFGHRVFTDSAPVAEVELASRSGIGWRGKHTLALHRDAGSMFFLGEIFVDLPLPLSAPVAGHCGSCSACLAVCPTQAIVAPYRLDARRCIAYLTIEHAGPIPVELRPLIGNRIYGCDDCQLACPWNKYAVRATLPDFDERAPLVHATLLDLWAWDEAAFLRHTEGSAIRRIGWQRWRRNLAVALGNALRADATAALLADALRGAREAADELVREHIDWALAQRHPAAARLHL